MIFGVIFVLFCIELGVLVCWEAFCGIILGWWRWTGWIYNTFFIIAMDRTLPRKVEDKKNIDIETYVGVVTCSCLESGFEPL
jgi:hypothetical protein